MKEDRVLMGSSVSFALRGFVDPLHLVDKPPFRLACHSVTLAALARISIQETMGTLQARGCHYTEKVVLAMKEKARQTLVHPAVLKRLRVLLDTQPAVFTDDPWQLQEDSVSESSMSTFG